MSGVQSCAMMKMARLLLVLHSDLITIKATLGLSVIASSLALSEGDQRTSFVSNRIGTHAFDHDLLYSIVFRNNLLHFIVLE